MPADGDERPIAFAPGQHITVKAQENVNTSQCFVTSATGMSHLQCCVKGSDSDGTGLTLGAMVDVTSPTGACCSPDIPKLLISAGIGAAPMKSFLESNPGQVRFAMHVDEIEASHPFRKEFRRACVDGLVHYTAKEGPAKPLSLVKVLEPHLHACDLILCGPVDFVESMRHALTSVGAHSIHCLPLSA
jgi:ferredoxin-NADP reductase